MNAPLVTPQKPLVLEKVLSTNGSQLIEEPSPSTSNWQSYLYIMLFVMNSVMIVFGEGSSFVYLLVLLQGMFFVGLLELTHQSVHRNFVTNRTVNEVIGTFAASLVGFNLIAYRYFHLEHHRHTCDDDDPEGVLYIHSPTTRWSLLSAPVAHVWVAFSINGLAKRFVPKVKSPELLKHKCVLMVVLGGICVLAFMNFALFLNLYLLPLCLFAYLDSFFSQAEHYDASVRKASERIDVATVTYDVQVPLILSHLMLNRNLHRVHHVWPRTRWFDAPSRVDSLNVRNEGRVWTFPAFVVHWFKSGPRLWIKSD